MYTYTYVYIYIYTYIYIYREREREMPNEEDSNTKMSSKSELTLNKGSCGDFTPKADMGEGLTSSIVKHHILKHHIPERPSQAILFPRACALSDRQASIWKFAGSIRKFRFLRGKTSPGRREVPSLAPKWVDLNG